jgi:hypothetical protein
VQFQEINVQHPKKNQYSMIEVQNHHFYRDCFEFFFNFILVYRSMWTIDRSQRVEEKKNIDLLSVKYGIWYLLTSLKKMSPYVIRFV